MKKLLTLLSVFAIVFMAGPALAAKPKTPVKKIVANTTIKKTTVRKKVVPVAKIAAPSAVAVGAITKPNSECMNAIAKANAHCLALGKGCNSQNTSEKCVAANAQCEAEQNEAMALCPAVTQ